MVFVVNVFAFDCLLAVLLLHDSTSRITLGSTLNLLGSTLVVLVFFFIISFSEWHINNSKGLF